MLLRRSDVQTCGRSDVPDAAPCLFLNDVFYLFRAGQLARASAPPGEAGFIRHESPVTSH